MKRTSLTSYTFSMRGCDVTTKGKLCMSRNLWLNLVGSSVRRKLPLLTSFSASSFSPVFQITMSSRGIPCPFPKAYPYFARKHQNL